MMTNYLEESYRTVRDSLETIKETTARYKKELGAAAIGVTMLATIGKGTAQASDFEKPPEMNEDYKQVETKIEKGLETRMDIDNYLEKYLEGEKQKTIVKGTYLLTEAFRELDKGEKAPLDFKSGLRMLADAVGDEEGYATEGEIKDLMENINTETARTLADYRGNQDGEYSVEEFNKFTEYLADIELNRDKEGRKTTVYSALAELMRSEDTPEYLEEKDPMTEWLEEDD